MAIEIVTFPINSMVIFHSYVTVYRRVYHIKSHKTTILDPMKPPFIVDFPLLFAQFTRPGMDSGCSMASHGFAAPLRPKVHQSLEASRGNCDLRSWSPYGMLLRGTTNIRNTNRSTTCIPRNKHSQTIKARDDKLNDVE